ncbi:hypothetical protein [Nocardia sp. 348MFTsu5.1]|uniref:hypothetical protein n=1 Tax=Nocardia sp. 348MFTsu5.1 TaxID=1172185 RepID=UPI000368A068|nr:hypothetical protein [Nocardia sp. 348MFTsu5.1]
MTRAERNLANPLYAAVGAGDLALKSVTDVITQLRERTETATETAQARFDETKTTAQARFEETKTTAQSRLEETRERLSALPEEVPSNIDELRAKFTADELRKVAEAYIEVAANIYNSLAERGEETVVRLRATPAVEEQLSRVEKVYGDAVDLTEDTLGTISSQTRAVGQRAAKLAGLASDKIVDVAGEVEDVADKIEEATDNATDAINGAAGTVEAKARTASDSPAKKIAEAKAPAKAPAKKAPAKAPAKKAPAKKATTD